MDLLYLRQHGQPLPEAWTSLLKTADAHGLHPRASRADFYAWLRLLQTSWQEASGARDEEDRDYMVELVSDMHGCWDGFDAMVGTLFLAYHRLGCAHAGRGSLGGAAHRQEFARLILQHIGLEASPRTEERIVKLAREFGRRAVVEAAEPLSRPSQQYGARDMAAILAHRVREASGAGKMLSA